MYGGEVAEIRAIKKPATSQLGGKTFTGSYYKPNGSILHQQFFYSFSADGKTVGAGLQPGNTLRTEACQSIGNIGAFVKKVSGTGSVRSDSEFMVLLDGKLLVSYFDRKSSPWQTYYGSFVQQ